MDRPFRWALGADAKPQSRALPRLSGHWAGSITSATSSVPPASSNSTATLLFSDSRRASTDPAEPDPQTTKSYRAAMGSEHT